MICTRHDALLKSVALFGLFAMLLATACISPPATKSSAPSDVQPVSALVPVAEPSPSAHPKPTLVGGMPLYATWPKDKKPDAVLVLSGQTFGYLQPCGCSRPQIGGLERRAMLIDSLKAKGWPVVGIDLGDIHPEKTMLARQGQLKYAATMHALREMGYIAVGIGATELKHDLYKLIAEYSLQKEQRPFLLAANIVGVADGKVISRTEYFPSPTGNHRALIEAIEVEKVGEVTVGVAGVVGKALQEENLKHKWDVSIDFPNAKAALESTVAALAKHPAKPQLNVLIFQGPSADAAKIARDFPQFQVILCQSDTDLPPMLPSQPAGTRTQVVQVGHRGQHVGVLGAFKKADGTFEFHYQLVPLTEEFLTPGTEEEAKKRNPVLPVLEDYAQQVKAANLLSQYPRVPHPEQIKALDLNPPVQLSYVGSAACQACHEAEYKKWKEHHHSHAMETLERYAKRPSLRNFDGECVQCHSVGFHYRGGYVDDKTTPHLRDVGCESCHGPGSGHVAAPKNQQLLAFLSPWKQPDAPKLPDVEFMTKMAEIPAAERGKVAIPAAQLILINRVQNMCIKCHDHEADPHFDIYKSWPKVNHSGLAPAGGWPTEAPAAK